VLNGSTDIIAHVGYPTATFKSPLIYNPWFARQGINAAVVPLGVKREEFAAAFPALARLTNLRGMLITMPHKVAVVGLLDEVSTRVKSAGACNAVRRSADGRLIGDMFDGEGFVRGVTRKGLSLAGKRVLIVGAGGVGSAIAASTAEAGAAAIALFDVNSAATDALAGWLRYHHPTLAVTTGARDADGFDVVVNATPLGMSPSDPMPLDVARLAPSTFVADAVLERETTAFLAAARARGCVTQAGLDMLFEQIPAYLEFFGFPAATADALRDVAEIAPNDQQTWMRCQPR
jgi:shikimate dehydrogenase